MPRKRKNVLGDLQALLEELGLEIKALKLDLKKLKARLDKIFPPRRGRPPKHLYSLSVPSSRPGRKKKAAKRGRPPAKAGRKKGRRGPGRPKKTAGKRPVAKQRRASAGRKKKSVASLLESQTALRQETMMTPASPGASVYSPPSEQ